MKKIMTVICALLISTALFADVIIQQDFKGIGLNSWKAGSNLPITDSEGMEYAGFDGIAFSTLYEFNSDKNTKVHWFTGLDTGFSQYGLEASAVGGLSTTIASAGSSVLDLSADIRLGTTIHLLGTWDPLAEADVMLSIMKADRKGLYASIGLSDHIINHSFPAMNPADCYIENYTGLILATGWRF